MQVACLESDMASFIKPFSFALEDVNIGKETMFKGTLFVELCVLPIAVYWVVKFSKLIGWGDKKREIFETVYPNTDLIYVGALVTVSTCMWPHYTGDERCK